MFSKDVTFKGTDGKLVTKKFYFNLTKMELTKQILREAGNVSGTPEEGVKILGDRFEEIGKSDDKLLILETFEDMIKASIGRRTDDELFIKTQEYAEAFLSSNAYDALIDFLISDLEYAKAFINGLLPDDLTDARARSEAQLQGYQQKQEAPTQSFTPENLQVVETPAPASQPSAEDLAAFHAWQEQQKAVGNQTSGY